MGHPPLLRLFSRALAGAELDGKASPLSTVVCLTGHLLVLKWMEKLVLWTIPICFSCLTG